MAMQKKAAETSADKRVEKRGSILEATIEARRTRRMAALRKVAGIWAHRPDSPADGLEYQRALRALWR